MSARASNRACSRPLSVLLPYRPPYDWANALSFYRLHAVSYLESVDETGYERLIPVGRGLGWFRVEHEAAGSALRLTIWGGDENLLSSIAVTVRRMFDLDADPAVLTAAISRDADLARIWLQNPGLRLCRYWSAFEALVTTVLGQLVSIEFGRTLTRELMHAAGTPRLHPQSKQRVVLFPTARQVLRSDLATVRTSEARRTTLRSLAALIEDAGLDWEQATPGPQLKKTLRSIRGIGAWTADYVAMRGFGDNDAFPATDYGLKRELERHPDIDPDRTRPWRAYAAVALWKSYLAAKLAGSAEKSG